MTVFIIAPLTGWLIPVTVAAGVLLLTFEAWLVAKLWRQTQAFPAKLRAAELEGARDDAYAKQPI